MLNEAQKDSDRLWWRKQFLLATMASMRAYKSFRDPQFMEYAKYFASLSKELKNEI